MTSTTVDTYMVASDHLEPINPLNGTATVKVLTGDTVYYADRPYVTATSNQGSLTVGQSRSFIRPAWLRSASLASIQVTLTGPPDEATVDSIQLGASNGTDDTAVINVALLTGSVVKGKSGQTYRISTPLIIPANTTLDMTGCTISYAAGITAVFNMLQNQAVIPVATATDAATTATSAVVTSPTLAAVAQAGQQLAVVGGGPAGGNGGGAIWLYGTVLSVAGSNITLTSNNINGIAATNTLTGATAYLFNRDANITIIGGLWDGGTAYGVEGGANAAWHSFNSHQMRLRRIDSLTVRDVSVKLTSFPAGGGWVFGINPADCTDYVIERCTGIGASAVVQGDGPLYRGTIRDIRGTTQDDMVAFGCVGFQGNDVEGDIIDLVVDGVEANNSYTAVKFFGGTGANSAQRIMSGVTARTIKGTTQQGVVNIIEYAGTTWFEGTIENVTAAPGGSTYQQVYIAATQAQTVNVNGLQWPSRAATPASGVIATGRPVANLIVRNLDLRCSSGTGIGLFLSDSAGTGVGSYSSVTVDGFTAIDSAPIVYAVRVATTRPISRLAVQKFQLSAASGSVLIYNASTPVVSEVEATGGRIDGTNNFCYYSTLDTNASTVRLAQLYIANATTGGALATLSHPGTVIVSNCELNLSQAAVFANGASATPVRVIGSSIRSIGASTVLLTRSASQAISMTSPQATVAISALTPTTGDMVNNSTATTTAPTGLVVYDGTRWRSLQTPASLASGTATLVAGTSGSIANTAITANSLVRLTNIGVGGTVGILSVALAAGTGFTINSSSGTDTSKVFWELVQY